MISKQVQIGNHIIAIYSNQEAEYEEAFRFLKEGLDNDEVILIITNHLSKDDIRERMKKEWNINVSAFESRGIINIKTTQEWYYNNGFPDPEKIKMLWLSMTQIAAAKRRRGLRVFADTHTFFENGHGTYLVNYESILEPEFDFPLTAICAYGSDDISSLPEEQQKTLFAHHNSVWK